MLMSCDEHDLIMYGLSPQSHKRLFVSVVTNALDRQWLWRMSAIHQRLQIKRCPRRLIFVLVRAVAHCILWMILFNFLVALPNISHHDAIMNDGYVWWNYFLCQLWYKSTPMSSENNFFQLNDNDNESEDCSRLLKCFLLRIELFAQNQWWIICSKWVWKCWELVNCCGK